MNYIPLAHVGACIGHHRLVLGLPGLMLGLSGFMLSLPGFAFGLPSFCDTDMMVSTTQSPNAKGIALQWNIGLKHESLSNL